MRKLLLLSTLMIITLAAHSQFFQKTPGNFIWDRGMFKKTLYIPTGCGSPVLNADTTNVSAMYYDSCGHNIYYYDPASKSWGTSSVTWSAGYSTYDARYLQYSGGRMAGDIRMAPTVKLRWGSSYLEGDSSLNRIYLKVNSIELLRLKEDYTLLIGNNTTGTTANVLQVAGNIVPSTVNTNITAPSIGTSALRWPAYLSSVDIQSGIANFTTLTLNGNSLQEKTERNVSNGYCGLDAGGKVSVSQLPASLFIYKGTWNASTNSPSLSDGTGVSGNVYEVSVAGSQNLGSGSLSFAAGDKLIHNGVIWQKSPGTAFVNSVNGQQGIVSISTDNVAEGSVNQYYTDVRARNAISATSPINYNISTGVIGWSGTKSDVGLSNVDNTSDATKNSATVTLTNKTISGVSNTLTNISTSSLVYPSVVSLTDGTTITWNYANGYSAYITLGGNRTLAISNPVANTFGVLKVTQDGVGSRSINSWPANSKFPSGSISFTSAVGAVDILSFWYDGSNYYWNIANDVK